MTRHRNGFAAALLRRLGAGMAGRGQEGSHALCVGCVGGGRLRHAAGKALLRLYCGIRGAASAARGPGRGLLAVAKLWR